MTFPFIYSAALPYVSLSECLVLTFCKINDELLHMLKALESECFVESLLALCVFVWDSVCGKWLVWANIVLQYLTLCIVRFAATITTLTLCNVRFAVTITVFTLYKVRFAATIKISEILFLLQDTLIFF
jgi:hypothetical protein